MKNSPNSSIKGKKKENSKWLEYENEALPGKCCNSVFTLLFTLISTLITERCIFDKAFKLSSRDVRCLNVSDLFLFASLCLLLLIITYSLIHRFVYEAF